MSQTLRISKGDYNITTASNANVIFSTGNIAIGTSNALVPDAELTIFGNPQTVAYPLTGNSLTSGTDLHITGADGVITRVTQDSFGTNTYVAFTGRNARGTAASPSQSLSGDILTQFTARGFSNGSLQFGTTSTGRVDVIADGNFTDTSRATKLVVYTTSSGSITPTAAATFEANGTTTFASNVTINGNLTVTNVSYINQETVTTTEVIQGNLTANALTVNLSLTTGTTLQAKGGLQNTPIGNVAGQASTGSFTTVTANGNITAAAIASNASITAITTLSALGGIQNTPIGNVAGQASSGSFTTITANGNITASAMTVNNSATIGTTLGVTGNINAGNVTTTGTLYGNAAPGATGTTSNAVGYLGMPQNSQNANYTLALIDQGKHVYITANSNVTIPANSSVSFPIGSTISVINAANIQCNISITTDTLYLAANGATGTRNLSSFGMATLVKVTNTVWYINGSGVS
jgi:hypothetical protein